MIKIIIASKFGKASSFVDVFHARNMESMAFISSPELVGSQSELLGWP